MKDQNDNFATQEEVFAALVSLTPDELRQLDYMARKRAFGTIYATGQAIFGEAVERALDLRRKWYPAQKSFMRFLINTMGSLSSNDRKGFHNKNIANVSALATGDDEVDVDAFLSSIDTLTVNSVEDELVRAEEKAALLRDYDALFAHFADDEEVWTILVAMEQGLIGIAIKEYCNLSDTQYVAARKRLNRGVAKLKSQRTEL